MIRWALLGSLCILSSALASTAVPRVRSINLSEPQLDLITSFLASSYERYSHEKPVADVASATEVIDATAAGLGENGGLPILIKVHRRNTEGATLAQAELRLEVMEELPVVTDRLAESLVKQVPLEQTQNRHNVAMAENRKETRVGTEKVLGAKLWFGMPVARAANLNAIGAVQFDARFERQTYFFELGAGFIIPGPSSSPTSEGYGGVMAELGASKYLNDGDTAVYLGGGLMPRLIFSSMLDSPLSLAPFAQFGVMFDRASRMRLYADLRVAQNVIPLRLANGPTGNVRTAFPTEITAAMGVGW